MDLVTFATNQKAQTLRQDMDVGVLSKLKDQQEREGQAAVRLIATAGSVAGAPQEPGKGLRVDVRA